ncbi:MAG TPA: hypothetical protein VML94_07760 [Thermoplasmata archaeon]|nr:hypothetical protein [Thermoplasmata archaeon]
MPESEFQEALRESKRAAKDLAVASARLTKHLLAKAGTAARDPKGSASKAARRVGKELEAASQQIDKILKDL